MAVDYSDAAADGTLINGATVGVKLYGFETVNCLASMIDVGNSENLQLFIIDIDSRAKVRERECP